MNNLIYMPEMAHDWVIKGFFILFYSPWIVYAIPEISNILANIGGRGNSAICRPSGDVKLPASSRAKEKPKFHSQDNSFNNMIEQQQVKNVV